MAATRIGQTVRAQTEITEIEGWRVTFKVQVWDEHELIGEGTHIRFVIDKERFLKRLAEKVKGIKHV